MTGVVVTKSSPVVVVGASPPTGGIIALTSFDKCFAPAPSTLILVYDQPIDDPVGTIRKALSQALVHYHPMAGHVIGADEEEPTHIVCTGEGVPFVGASASCALDDAVKMSPLHLMDLALRYPAEYCRPGDPLMLLQVTRFTCGGFVVGVTWNHVMADGAGVALFLQAVGELARGMPVPSVVPVRFEADSSLPCLPQPMVSEVRSHMRADKEELLPFLDVTIPMSLVNFIRAKYGAGNCSVYDATAAVLWRCRTRAITSDDDDDPNAPMLLVIPTNARELVGAKKGYYGNCVIFQLALATRHTVGTGDIRDLVKLIRLAKEKMPSDGRDEQHAQQAPERYNKLTISSARNLGNEEVDFGSGMPSRMIWKTEKPVGMACVVCSQCKGKDNINVMSLCVKPEHADAFIRELAALNIEVRRDWRPSPISRL